MEKAGPTTEEREQRVSEDYAKRGITYEVDSSDLVDSTATSE